MHRHLLPLLALACVLPAARAQDDAKSKPIKALLVTGGCCHDYSKQKLIITEGTALRTNIEWTIVHQGGKTTNTKIDLYKDKDWAEGYDIVVHNECFAKVDDLDFVQQILTPHRNGTPAVLIHCAMHCYRTGTDRWFEFCGVTSHRHGAHYPYTVQNKAADHPAMANFGAAWDNPKGELYHTAKLWPTAKPLAVAKRKDNGEEQVCVWTNQYGKGRVFGTTIGHYNDSMVEPAYLDMLTRGILWACDRDVEANLRTPTEAENQKIRDLIKAPTGKVPTPAKDPKAGKKAVQKGNAVYKANATASSEETGKNNVAARATDGDLSTRWCASNGSNPQWLRIDFKEPQKLRSLRIYWEKPDGQYSYTVEATRDGKSWSELVDASEGGKENAVATHTVAADDVTAIRINYLGAHPGAYWGSIWEVEAFDTEKPPAPLVTQQKKSGSEASLADVKIPEGFTATLYGAPPQVNYPTCLEGTVDGRLFVGVDPQGSLGKKDGDGKVLLCSDPDGDGVADEFSTFCQVDHPRGLHYEAGKLWVLHPPFLSLFSDSDGDGVADSQQTLIKNISTEQVEKRGADHTTNNIEMGIDGWLYIAVGDFGFVDATGTDGKSHTRRGGGIVRVRPDGSDLEVYAWGLRNIMDVAISPTLDIFTRDNTNDGGGWDIRTSHILQTAEYGYPSKYLHFVDETMPPLADHGGGSGCGSLYLADTRWPVPYADSFYSCDWGRSEVYRHTLPRTGATFAPHQESFIRLPRPTDADVDGLGRMYVASWKNGKFSYSGENVGFVTRIIPDGYEPGAAINLDKLTSGGLVEQLASPSSRVRLAAQQRLIAAEINFDVRGQLVALMNAADQSDAVRVAALWTLKQADGAASHEEIVELLATGSPAVRRNALRALTDRMDQLDNLPGSAIVKALADSDARVVAQAVIALSRASHIPADEELLKLTRRDESLPLPTQEPLHKQADPGRVLPHLAVRALVERGAVDACLAALGGEFHAGAVQVLRQLHAPEAVSGVIAKLRTERDADARRDLLTILMRQMQTEADYKGDWWGTRPDTRGPYYDPEPTESADRIAGVLRAAYGSGDDDARTWISEQLTRHLIKLDGIGSEGDANAEEAVEVVNVPKADPNDPNVIANLDADVVRSRVTSTTGNASKGATLFKAQSCTACHTYADGQMPKGPHLVDIGKRAPLPELITSIIEPGKKITQGFDSWTFLMEDGTTHSGFVSRESAKTIELRQADGRAVTLEKSGIEFRKKQETSMMPKGIVGNLTPEQLADLVAYLQSL